MPCESSNYFCLDWVQLCFSFVSWRWKCKANNQNIMSWSSSGSLSSSWMLYLLSHVVSPATRRDRSPWTLGRHTALYNCISDQTTGRNSQGCTSVRIFHLIQFSAIVWLGLRTSRLGSVENRLPRVGRAFISCSWLNWVDTMMHVLQILLISLNKMVGSFFSDHWWRFFNMYSPPYFSQNLWPFHEDMQSFHFSTDVTIIYGKEKMIW